MRRFATILTMTLFGAGTAFANTGTGSSNNNTGSSSGSSNTGSTGATGSYGSTGGSTSGSVNSQSNSSTGSTSGSIGSQSSLNSKMNVSGGNPDLQKHLALVDVYLNLAISNTKALQNWTQYASGSDDATLVDEVRGNIDTSLAKAIRHIDSLKNMKQNVSGSTKDTGNKGGSSATNTPGTTSATGAIGSSDSSVSGVDFAKLDSLEQQIRDAQASVKKLKTGKLSGLSTDVDSIASNLMQANQTFRDFARGASYTLLQD